MGKSEKQVKYSSTRGKVLVALSVLLIVAFMGVSYVNYTASKHAVRQELLTSGLPLTRDTIYSELQKVLMRPFMVASSMANDSFMKDWVRDGEKDPERMRSFLQGMRDKYGFFTTFFVSENTSNYYHFTGVLKKISRMTLHDVWYYEFVARGEEFDLDVDENEAASDVVTLFINFRVEDEEGDLAGVTGVGLKLDTVSDMLERFQTLYGRQVYMVDQFGTVQMHSDHSLLEKANIRSMEGIRSIAAKVLSVHDDARNFEYDTASGQHMLVSVRYIPELNWSLIVEQEEGAALASARGNFVRTALVGIGVWALLVVATVVSINRYQRQLERMATTDPLTKTANRRAFDARFVEAVSRHSRHGEAFCVLLLDLDSFKLVNDIQGHVEGDRVLVAIAGAIRKVIRPDDHLARWGGDEFIVLVRGDEEKACLMAERIRFAVRELGITVQGKAVTVSCGVSPYQSGESLDSITNRADVAVYEAKRGGRDSVCSA